VEALLWTGPAGHLLGGSLDLLQALGGHALARAGTRVRRLAGRPGPGARGPAVGRRPRVTRGSD